MSTAARGIDLWSLVPGRPEIDPEDLLRGIEQTCCQTNLDYRTRLLVRDSIAALEQHWSRDQLHARLSPHARKTLPSIVGDAVGEGFPTLAGRIVKAVEVETVLQFFRDLGSRIRRPSSINVGGSIALMLANQLRRSTDDIDVVDAIPPALRNEHELLDQLVQRYGLCLAHFQSRYLPSGWENRLRSNGKFGSIEVQLVDPYDIFVGKLFSPRDKDLDDLRVLLPSMDRAIIEDRLRSSAGALRSDEHLRKHAERNWYVLFGEPLSQRA